MADMIIIACVAATFVGSVQARPQIAIDIGAGINTQINLPGGALSLPVVSPISLPTLSASIGLPAFAPPAISIPTPALSSPIVSLPPLSVPSLSLPTPSISFPAVKTPSITIPSQSFLQFTIPTTISLTNTAAIASLLTLPANTGLPQLSSALAALSNGFAPALPTIPQSILVPTGLPAGLSVKLPTPVVLPTISVSLPTALLPTITTPAVIGILQGIGNEVLQSLAEDLTSILGVFAAAASASTLTPLATPALPTPVLSAPAIVTVTPVPAKREAEAEAEPQLVGALLSALFPQVSIPPVALPSPLSVSIASLALPSPLIVLPSVGQLFPTALPTLGALPSVALPSLPSLSPPTELQLPSIALPTGLQLPSLDLSLPSVALPTGLGLPSGLQIPSLALPSLALPTGLPSGRPSGFLTVPTALPTLGLPFPLPSAGLPAPLFPANLSLSLPSVTAPSLTIPTNIIPGLDLGSVVLNIIKDIPIPSDLPSLIAATEEATTAALTNLTTAIIAQAQTSLAFLNLLALVDPSSFSGLSQLTDIAAVQTLVGQLSQVDLIAVVDAITQRGLIYSTALDGLLTDPLTLVETIGNLAPIVENLPAAVSFLVLQQLGVLDLAKALGVGS